MGKFDGIVILTDLDGTFLSSRSGIVERNIQAIEYFKSEGGRFSLATGRMHYNLESLIPHVDCLTNAPAILCNGTYLYDFASGTIVAEQFMNADVALAAALYVHENFTDIRLRVSRHEGYLLFEEDTYSLHELLAYGIDTYEVKPAAEWDGLRWYKMVLSGTAQRVNALEGALKQQFPGVFEYNRSRATSLELQMKGTNKASLLNELRRVLEQDTSPCRICVCGDYENDRAILKAADIAVCPDNALPEIKAICRLCLCSNDDGVVADLVETLCACGRGRSLF